ncbi:hypothetical protein EPI10_023483 [Gossypium australe]|uniref:Uncharacterized protein n=1 Tax=Gossypium australe TaxID=47621 RepID=A0A5B6VVP8_9ROSI|nr:hypothetical protein EPI10_023483 [Gossypium australe]
MDDDSKELPLENGRRDIGEVGPREQKGTNCEKLISVATNRQAGHNENIKLERSWIGESTGPYAKVIQSLSCLLYGDKIRQFSNGKSWTLMQVSLWYRCAGNRNKGWVKPCMKRLRSFSNNHIDVDIKDSEVRSTWRMIGF